MSSSSSSKGPSSSESSASSEGAARYVPLVLGRRGFERCTHPEEEEKEEEDEEEEEEETLYRTPAAGVCICRFFGQPFVREAAVEVPHMQ